MIAGDVMAKASGKLIVPAENSAVAPLKQAAAALDSVSSGCQAACTHCRFGLASAFSGLMLH